MKTVFITIPVGQSIRDFLVLDGIKDILAKSKGKLNVVVLSPAYNVPSFANLCEASGVIARRCETPNHFRPNARLRAWRRKRNLPDFVKKVILRLEVFRYKPPAYLHDLFKEFNPSALISTHPMTAHDYHVSLAARKYKCPVLGIVKSWDNLIKGLSVHADKLSVWSERNKREAIKFNGYAANNVEVNGAISFDPYFQKEWLQSKQEFADTMNLDPSRKIVTIATAGSYGHGFYGIDETHHTLDVINILNNSEEFQDAQIIVRLHPVSKLEHFLHLKDTFPNIVFSHGSYIPTLGWYIDKAGMIEQVNILAHSDVIITPGSSWVIEAAIFDTPVVVTFYSTLQPEHAKLQYGSYLSAHHAPIAMNDWVPICYSFEETRKELLTSLSNPSYYSQERKILIENYVEFTDGMSSTRIAEWISDFL